MLFCSFYNKTQKKTSVTGLKSFTTTNLPSNHRGEWQNFPLNNCIRTVTIAHTGVVSNHYQLSIRLNCFSQSFIWCFFSYWHYSLPFFKIKNLTEIKTIIKTTFSIYTNTEIKYKPETAYTTIEICQSFYRYLFTHYESLVFSLSSPVWSHEGKLSRMRGSRLDYQWSGFPLTSFRLWIFIKLKTGEGEWQRVWMLTSLPLRFYR